MIATAIRLLRIELTVSDLSRAERFYVEALGFELTGRSLADATLLDASHVEQSTLRRGAQLLALQAFDPPGALYPANATAADALFQHFALPVPDMAVAYARLAAFSPTPITHGGPQRLPARSGGVTAYKFRDPDGHPLELIQFPDARSGGIDHSAIAVLDTARSIAFYTRELGLRVAAQQVNTGPEQDALDGLPGVTVDVVALTPADATPHLELLGYRAPPGRPTAVLYPADIAATRLVLACDLPSGTAPQLLHDPDGHTLILRPAP